MPYVVAAKKVSATLINWSAMPILETAHGFRRNAQVIRANVGVVTGDLEEAVNHALDGDGIRPGNPWTACTQGRVDLEGPTVCSGLIDLDAEDEGEDEGWTAERFGSTLMGHVHLPDSNAPSDENLNPAVTDLAGNPLNNLELEGAVLEKCRQQGLI